MATLHWSVPSIHAQRKDLKKSFKGSSRLRRRHIQILARVGSRVLLGFGGFLGSRVDILIFDVFV